MIRDILPIWSTFIIVDEGNWQCYIFKCCYLFPFEATQRMCYIMYFVLLFLHFPESLCKDDICCTTCVHQDIMNQESFYDAKYDHGIIVRIILDLKVLLRECDWHMRPFGFDVGSLHSNILYPSLGLLFLLLVGWFKAWTACDRKNELRRRRWLNLMTLRSHCCGRGSEFTGGGHQCWSLVFYCCRPKTRQHIC